MQKGRAIIHCLKEKLNYFVLAISLFLGRKEKPRAILTQTSRKWGPQGLADFEKWECSGIRWTPAMKACYQVECLSNWLVFKSLCSRKRLLLLGWFLRSVLLKDVVIDQIWWAYNGLRLLLIAMAKSNQSFPRKTEMYYSQEKQNVFYSSSGSMLESCFLTTFSFH